MIEVRIEPGTYVVAVSGGVDSMVLLDVLNKQVGVELIVAHFDHGIRSDSGEDRQLVEQAAKSYGIPYGFSQGKLGPRTSEAAARKVRYAFLEQMQKQHGAKAIITAHHQDDVLETTILNMMRGTNRRGLSSLRSTESMVRPLLGYSKAEILAYAETHQLAWREDSTNEDESYLRNYVRRRLLPRFSEAERQRLVDIITESETLNEEIDVGLRTLLAAMSDQGEINRQSFALLEHVVARELLAAWLRQNHFRDYDAYTLERLVVAAKTGAPNTRVDVAGALKLCISKHKLALKTIER